MPLYEYECEAQGHRFEVIRKFSYSPLETCPQCGSPVRKLISSPAFQFKGSGWYITDYAKKDATSGGKAAKDGGGTEATSGDKTSTEKTSTDKGSADKDSADKGTADKGTSTTATTPSTSTKNE